MRHGLSYFQSVIIPLVPIFYRRVDTALANIGQPRLPLDSELFKFGSWMGGDRWGACCCAACCVLWQHG
jgi:phosphoenolpyruvate carboxylase